MDPWLLVATHAVTASVSALGMRWWILRRIQVREVEGHPTLEYRPRPHNEENHP